MSDISLSIIIPYLNSHEIVRRQVLHLQKIGLNDFKDVELIIVDDGSDIPISVPDVFERFTLFQTNDKRPWTSSLARNRAVKIAKGDWCFMIDGDYILSRLSIEIARAFKGDRLGVRRQFGVLDDKGDFSQDWKVLQQWGLPLSRLQVKGTTIPPHPNQFIIRKQLFFDMGGYDEDRIINKTYPQGEDNLFKKTWLQFVTKGLATQPPVDCRPTVYMFPNGQFCGDVDTNPFGLFHELSRKNPHNPWKGFRFDNRSTPNPKDIKREGV